MKPWPTTIRLHDTDAAGRLYFAHQFRLCHEAYEAFLEERGFPLRELLRKGTLALPIVRAEADYRRPLQVGDRITILVRPIRIGSTSFTLLSRIICGEQTAGHVTTVHVAVDPRRGTKRALPAALRAALKSA